MNTLYISDLDGTLLNKKAQPSGYTIETLNNLIAKGMHFTVATARTSATAVKILEKINLELPIILMNGAAIFNIKSKKHLHTNPIDEPSIISILEITKKININGFMYEVKDNQLITYYETLNSPPLINYYNERVINFNKTFKQVADFSNMNHSHVIFFSFIGNKDKLDLICKHLTNLPNISFAYYKDIYPHSNNYHLEIFSYKATKYNGAQFIRNHYKYDYLIGFGDNLNDLPLFNACDETCAVSNAHKKVLDKADHIIDSNTNDGVARWLNDNHIL